MEVVDKIKVDHERLAKQLRIYKKKMKNRLPVSKLKEMLTHEKQYEIDWRDYHSWGSVNDEAYSRDVARQEARVQLLEELIQKYG